MVKRKKMVFLVVVIVLGGLNGSCFSAQGEQEMSILPVFDESGKVVSTSIGRRDLVKGALSGRQKGHKGTGHGRGQGGMGKKGMRDRRMGYHRGEKGQRDWKNRGSQQQRRKRSPEEITAKLNVLMQKIGAWQDDATMQRAQEIFKNRDLSDHLKLRKLKHLIHLVNQEFDKLPYVKEPGKFTPAEISMQEDTAFDQALKRMDNEKGQRSGRRSGGQKHGLGQGRDGRRYHQESRGYHPGQRPATMTTVGGCTSGTCVVK